MKNSEQEKNIFDKAFPKALRDAEGKLLEQSRAEREVPELKTGIGLSGGGIRSATFCLGFFQGLAKLDLLKKIDYLSTVSGGGYFGAFYTRLFTRNEIDDFDSVQKALYPLDRDKDEEKKESSSVEHKGNTSADKQDASKLEPRKVLNWLRENGRYLSPNGSGDLLLGGAVLLRNWVAVQIVLAISFLTVFLFMQWVRARIGLWFPDLNLWQRLDLKMVWMPGRLMLWVSPSWILAGVVLIFGAIPFGWAYWMVARPPKKVTLNQIVGSPLWGLLFVILVAGYFLVGTFFPELPGVPATSTTFFVADIVLGVAELTLLWFLVALLRAQVLANKEEKKEKKFTKYRRHYLDYLARHWVSCQLKRAMVLTVLMLAFTLIESFGQTAYLLLKEHEELIPWSGGLLAGLVALVSYARRIAVALGWLDGDKRAKGFSKALITTAAFLIVGTWLTTVSIGANAIAWGWKTPQKTVETINEKLEKKSAPSLMEAKTVVLKVYGSPWKIHGEKSYWDNTKSIDSRNTQILLFSLLIAAFLSFLFGRSWPFLNRSSHLPLYSARLTRAYLGASNPRRHKEEEGAVTQVMPGDDLDTHDYWPWPPPNTKANEGMEKQEKFFPYENGGPLHLINVTVNETIEGRSQIQQQDRKGVGMALGPSGISAGIRHHVVFSRGGENTGKIGVETFQTTDAGEGESTSFSMFDYKKEAFSGERLSLGQWLAISGAAFSTGLGSRTSLGLSLLTGFGNIRLGYWWDSGVNPRERKVKPRFSAGKWLGMMFATFFPVQAYLLDEFTARFHGSARKYWYLTDGGHFENLGGYELIRRRLPLIFLIDAEADPDYTFGGLANLIRKARLDFDAEIKFLDEKQLTDLFGEGKEHYFGTLEDLRRGKRVEKNLPHPKWKWRQNKKNGIEAVDHHSFSSAHAALAKVFYDGKEKGAEEKFGSWLVYIKPTLIGEEPADILEYHSGHPAFPQETTADQFFDEAQWESYRKLGDHIANVLFKESEKMLHRAKNDKDLQFQH